MSLQTWASNMFFLAQAKRKWGMLSLPLHQLQQEVSKEGETHMQPPVGRERTEVHQGRINIRLNPEPEGCLTKWLKCSGGGQPTNFCRIKRSPQYAKRKWRHEGEKANILKTGKKTELKEPRCGCQKIAGYKKGHSHRNSREKGRALLSQILRPPLTLQFNKNQLCQPASVIVKGAGEFAWLGSHLRDQQSMLPVVFGWVMEMWARV